MQIPDLEKLQNVWKMKKIMSEVWTYAILQLNIYERDGKLASSGERFELIHVSNIFWKCDKWSRWLQVTLLFAYMAMLEPQA